MRVLELSELEEVSGGCGWRRSYRRSKCWGKGSGKNSGKDRARFYEYALGSAREARTWYYAARHILDDSVVEQMGE